MSETPVTERSEKSLCVLAAATRVFLSHGFSGATTDMIQREAGVSKATMYAAFANKEAMFAAVIRQQCEAMAGTVRALRPAPGDITRTLTTLGRSYLAIILSPTGLALYRVAVAESARFPDLGREFYQAGPKMVATLVAARLADAARDGEIDVHAVGVDAAAGLFISMLRGDGQMEALMHPRARPSHAQVDRWVRLAVETFLQAFGVARSPNPPSASPPRKSR